MKQCRKGKHDKLLDPMYSCQSCGHKFTNKFNMHQHIASTPLCRIKIYDIKIIKVEHKDEKRLNRVLNLKPMLLL